MPVALVVVATEVERDAVIAMTTAYNDAKPQLKVYGKHTVFDLDQVGGITIYLGQSSHGSNGPSGMTLTAQALIDSCRPDYLIMTGICFGLKEDEQQLGDILVSTRIHDLDHRKVVDRDSGPVVIPRGVVADSAVTLLDRFRAATYHWVRPPALHFGLILSGSVLVNSRTIRTQLKETYPDALGGEMEGAGLYAACAKEKIDWIVVKAISDWGMDKTDGYQAQAAENAARFVVHMAGQGGLSAW